MGLRSSKQKSADITSSPSDKKSKKRGKKESINGDAGTEVTNQENGESVEKTTIENEKKDDELTSRNTQAEPANVDEDSATGSGGVTAPASPDTLQGVSEEGKLKQDELTTEKECKTPTSEIQTSEEIIQETDNTKQESDDKQAKDDSEREEPTNGIPTTIKWDKGGKDVAVVGSFSEWKDLLPLSEKDGVYILTSNLSAGEYYYKYQVDGEWTVDQNQPTTELEDQGTVNILTVSATE